MNPHNYEVEEINLVEVFFALVSRWLIILIVTAGLGILGLLVGIFLVTPQYASTSALYVLSKSTSITSMADIQVGANLTNDYRIVVTGRPVLEQVIENLELKENYEELRKKVTVENEANTRILNITVTDSDINRAKSITDEIAEVSSAFISEKMDQDPPTIIQYGYADTKPVSTSPLKYALIAAMLGFVISAGIVIVQYLLNDKIMTPEELEKKTGLNTLATLPYEH